METASPIQRRSLKRKDGSTAEFDVLLIDSHEKWMPASESKSTKTMEFGDRRISIELHGISLNEFFSIQQSTYIPQWDNADGEEPDPKWAEMKFDRVCDRRMALIEAALRTKFPGETIEERREYYKRRSTGEIQALMDAVHSHATCFVEMMNTPMIQDYRSCCESGLVVSSGNFFENWGEATNSQYTLLFQRPQDSFISELRLRGLTQEANIKIEKECEPGDPPLRAIRDQNNPRGRVIRSVPNTQDPEYQSRVSNCNKKKTLLQAEQCLTFQVPGTTFVERLEWLGSRIAGDVQTLKQFIDSKILSYEEELQTF